MHLCSDAVDANTGTVVCLPCPVNYLPSPPLASSYLFPSITCPMSPVSRTLRARLIAIPELQQKLQPTPSYQCYGVLGWKKRLHIFG